MVLWTDNLELPGENGTKILSPDSHHYLAWKFGEGGVQSG
jgi:hypothetical protein